MNLPLARAHRNIEGLATGDAFGELHFSVPDMYSRTALPDGPWPWTDDTHMALSVVEVLAARQHNGARMRLPERLDRGPCERGPHRTGNRSVDSH